MDETTLAFPTIVTSRRVVSNVPPLLDPTPYRLAIIGEAPGEDEENHGLPFVGKSGQFLNTILKGNGIDRNRCFVGNVCQVRPPGNRIEAFDWNGEEMQSGLARLKHDLNIFQPNLCLLLGGTPLRSARGPNHKITAWRGSLFRSNLLDSPFYARKCIASLHPAFVLREFEGYPLLNMDVGRAGGEALSPDLILPERQLLTDLDTGSLIHHMDWWPAGLRCSVDIEGGLPSNLVNENVKKDSKKRRHLNWKCVALAGRPTKAFAIPWWRFSLDDHCRLIQSFARLMERADVPKVLQNSLYDRFVLAYGYGIHVANVVEDTMLKGWENYCELPKGLGCQASVWTREPHWKDDEMYGGTGNDLAIGCCKDVAVTLEICNAQDGIPAVAEHLRAGADAHYRTNIEMLNPLLYMELRGIRYEKEKADTQAKEVRTELQSVGESLDRVAGLCLRGPKGSLVPQRLAKILYEVKGYPAQYKKEFGRKTNKYTTDVEALLALRRKLPGDEFLDGILRHRHLEGVIETLEVRPDQDGRIRCGYNAVGTDTGRVSCYTSPTGAGTNLQTITKKLRHLYVADPGYDFFQCDLAGADGWTVAAHCARLGDSTMLEDYYAGIKPAKVLAMLYAFGGDVNRLDRDSLVFWGKSDRFALVSELVGAGIYDCAKQVQHGSNYLMGIPTMQTNIMKRSHKETGIPIYMEHGDARVLQESYFSRYIGIRLWHQWAEAVLVSKGYLTSASGHTRIFFGRRFGRDILETVRQFLADEPQQNTTFATNLAMLRLWNDPENRRPDGSLIIEPLHQVHDALCGQWPQTCRDWARAKVRSYFQNPLTIAGTTLTIPFDGAYGPSWGETTNAL